MAGYWSRHRLLLSVILCVVTAIVAGLLFAFPYITQQASDYNSQSIYKNSEMDFIAPEPAYEQVAELAGSNGIGECFPFYLTKAQVTVNGKSRTGTVLLSDQFQNIDITMYNDDRLIEKAAEEPSAPILVDWQFCHDTGAKVGDKVSFTINGTVSEFEIYAIYETNSIYDGGAIIAKISTEQADGIRSNSKNGGYSGVFCDWNPKEKGLKVTLRSVVLAIFLISIHPNCKNTAHRLPMFSKKMSTQKWAAFRLETSLAKAVKPMRVDL